MTHLKNSRAIQRLVMGVVLLWFGSLYDLWKKMRFKILCLKSREKVLWCFIDQKQSGESHESENHRKFKLTNGLDGMSVFAIKSARIMILLHSANLSIFFDGGNFFSLEPHVERFRAMLTHERGTRHFMTQGVICSFAERTFVHDKGFCVKRNRWPWGWKMENSPTIFSLFSTYLVMVVGFPWINTLFCVTIVIFSTLKLQSTFNYWTCFLFFLFF